MTQLTLQDADLTASVDRPTPGPLAMKPEGGGARGTQVARGGELFCQPFACACMLSPRPCTSTDTQTEQVGDGRREGGNGDDPEGWRHPMQKPKGDVAITKRRCVARPVFVS